ncbi:MAG: hypothetical protein AAFR58_07495 [Cyanobacteria bacterium J06627_28]
MVLKVAGVKTVYLALFSLTLLAVIASSSAVMVLAGRGRDVLLFGTGVGIGMSLLAAMSHQLWRLSFMQLRAMETQIAEAMLAARLGQINPRLVLRSTAAPERASDVHLELECRRLLDRVHQLLEKAVDPDGHCRYCEQKDAHAETCPVVAAEALYQAGRARRVPWREYRKRLPSDTC